MGSRPREAVPEAPPSHARGDRRTAQCRGRRARPGIVLVFAGALGACTPLRPAPLLQPGLPGHDTLPIDVRAASDLSRVSYTADDVRFMEGMIGHHAQAITMVGLLESRSEREDLKLLGRRIAASQADEIAMMTDWLTARGYPPARSAESDHHHHEAGLMPGMLTAAQMAALSAAHGPTFDRLFLAGMIRHHEGALTMVRDLFGAPGAAQESEIFAFASDVDADQRMEIARMEALLSRMEEETR